MENDYKFCIGAFKCSTTDSMPLKKYADADEKTVCPSCKFYKTKLESVDDLISELLSKTVSVKGEEIQVLQLFSNLNRQVFINGVYEAFYLDGKKESGATFPFPDSLTTIQWTVLEAITNGRNRAQNEHDKKK